MELTLGEIIKTYRNQEQLSLEEFGAKCGLTKGYLSMLENNRDSRGREMSPRIETIARIAEAIGVEFDEFIEHLSPNQRVVVNGRKSMPLQELLESGADLSVPMASSKIVGSRNLKAAQGDPIVSACIVLFEQSPPEVQDRILDYFDMEIARRKVGNV